MNTKQKANIGIGKAIAHYTSLGLTVSLPLNDSQAYDLIVDFTGELQRIQVKYTTTKQVDLRSVSGSSRAVYSSVAMDKVDLLFVVSPNQMWEIPVKEIKQATAIRLNHEVYKYLVG